MRIKVNASQFEIEVLDRDYKRIYYVKGEGYESELDVQALMAELGATADDHINLVG